MAGQEIDFEEILIAPLEQIVKKIGTAVCETQIQIDKASLRAQEALEKEHPELAKLGYQITWYQIPELQAELKMVLHYEEDKEEEVKEKRYKVFWSSFNAKYKTHFNFQAEGSSTVKFKIVPIPPPVVLTVPPRKEES